MAWVRSFDGRFAVVVVAVVVGAAVIADRTALRFVEVFIVLSGLAGAYRVVGGTRDERADVRELLAELERDDDFFDPAELNVAEVLLDELGREVFAILDDAGEELTVGQLATRAAASRHDVAPEAVTPDQEREAFEELFGSVLSDLDAFGVVEFERERGLVALTPDGARLAEYLRPEPSTDDPPTVSGLDLSEVFEILRNGRRRVVVDELASRGGRTGLATVADAVARRETGRDGASLSDNDRKRVYVSLYQVHVPKLADFGLVDYDQESGTLGLTDDGERLATLARTLNHRLATDVAVSPDLVFELVRSPRQRRVLRVLSGTTDSMATDELATRVASVEEDVPPDEVTNRQRKRVYVALYQTHLPKLADAGVVDYDREGGTVGLTRSGWQVQRFLRTVTERVAGDGDDDRDVDRSGSDR